jgi:putative peptidoglycan lipid II flippase
MAYGGIKLLVSAFYSMHDTMTPVKTAFASVMVNAALSILFMFPLKLGGLALATTISATFNFLNLYRLLARKIGDFGTKAIVDSFLRAFLASCVMGIALKTAMVALPESGMPGLLITASAGAGSFIAACYIFDVREMKDSWAWITKRR